MRTTIKDPGTATIVKHQLDLGKVQYHEVTPVCDIEVQGHQFAVFTGMLFCQDAYLTAWIVTAMGQSGFFNQENYPEPRDAVAQHVGKLVLEGRLNIVDVDDGSEPDTEEPPPNDD